MDISSTVGNYSKSLITAIPADLKSKEAQLFKQTITKFPEEGVYIYSFKEGRMIYSDGWEEVLGYSDEEINMLLLVTLSSPEFAPFSYELNDKALKFLQTKDKDLEKYSFSIELKKIHKNGSKIPIIARVGVFDSENGKVTAIIGRYQVNRNLIFGKVMRYAAYGPEKEGFEEELNKALFQHLAISNKEKEALGLVAKGFSFKEIAHKLGVSSSAIEKRILPLYKRFEVKSLSHLVSFAYDNFILP
jgi:DNA-binding CsgD family transcriptional regulator